MSTLVGTPTRWLGGFAAWRAPGPTPGSHPLDTRWKWPGHLRTMAGFAGACCRHRGRHRSLQTPLRRHRRLGAGLGCTVLGKAPLVSGGMPSPWRIAAGVVHVCGCACPPSSERLRRRGSLLLLRRCASVLAIVCLPLRSRPTIRVPQAAPKAASPRPATGARAVAWQAALVARAAARVEERSGLAAVEGAWLARAPRHSPRTRSSVHCQPHPSAPVAPPPRRPHAPGPAGSHPPAACGWAHGRIRGRTVLRRQTKSSGQHRERRIVPPWGTTPGRQWHRPWSNGCTAGHDTRTGTRTHEAGLGRRWSGTADRAR